jgi:glycosyltransferase involved in cell wall biosynthesis
MRQAATVAGSPAAVSLGERPADPSRLAIFIPNFNGGGAQRAMLVFARELLGRGVRVDTIVASTEGQLARLLPPSATVVDLGGRGVLRGVPGLARYLRRARPAGLYSTMSYCNVAALLARRLAGSALPVVVREAVVPLSAEHANSLNGRIIRRLVQATYPSAQAIIAVSKDVAEELVRISRRIRDKIAVLPTPVVTDELLADAERPLDHPWFAAGAPPVVLGVGRLHTQKDFATLLRAFALVRRARPLRLLVLGEGPERRSLEALGRELGVADDVELAGFVDNPFVYLKRAAAFALSSRYEGMPTALLQAMALGTPVVSTDCPGGPREVLQNGRFGALVPMGDAPALAAAIGAAVDSPRRADVAEYARGRFGVREAATRYLTLLSGR